jgi:hypothetical protein
MFTVVGLIDSSALLGSGGGADVYLRSLQRYATSSLGVVPTCRLQPKSVMTEGERTSGVGRWLPSEPGTGSEDGLHNGVPL